MKTFTYKMKFYCTHGNSQSAMQHNNNDRSLSTRTNTIQAVSKPKFCNSTAKNNFLLERLSPFVCNIMLT